ncbi:MAG: PTS sugar transporter subunit IIA [Planctomycetota bacterium]|jgi:mannitol/fructose-specific phosphotransferase system IIA component (Ntr-type)/Kef-type K+ transport system membrane component KefB
MTGAAAAASPLFMLSIVLVAGVVAGQLAKRIHMPSVTGQILVGILIGPSVLEVFDFASIHSMEPVLDFALGLMAVAVGSHLNIRRLANARKRLGYLLFFEATLTPILVFTGTLAVGAPWWLALLLSAIAVSTAPATILSIVKETRSKGVFVRTLVAGVALNNLICILLFEAAHTTAQAHLEVSGVSFGAAVGAASMQFALSMLLGGGIGTLLVLVTKNVVRTDRLTALSFVAILMTVGVGEMTGVSPLLSCLFLGIALANLTPEKEEIGHTVFDNFEFAIFAVFFTVAGMELRFEYLPTAAVLASVVFAMRAVGKVTAGNFAMRAAHAPNTMRRHLGYALLPQAGLAVGLMLLVTEDPVFEAAAETRDLFLAVVLTVVLFNELVGPIMTRVALSRCGEIGLDRARIIDFLHEENISTSLPAGSKEEVIGRLVDLLISSNHLKVDRDEFLESVLAREDLATTCLGDGLAVPHGNLETGNGIVGAMGIWSQGLRLDAPDGHAVQCMVLLATPEEHRNRHLEVLAALVHAISSDRNVQHQLYQAKSPAHAYHLLHAEEEAEHFNYFLDED